MNTYKDVREDSLSKVFGILEREVSSSLMVTRFLGLNKLVGNAPLGARELPRDLSNHEVKQAN